MRRRLVAAAGLALAGAALALFFWIGGANPWFHLSVPLSTLVLLTGFAAAGVVVLRGLRRSRESRRVESAVERAQEEERSAHHRFLRRLDHEIKNPVTAIRSALAAAPENPAALDVADAQATRLSRLVTELAKLIDLETRSIERLPVDLEDMCRDAVDAVTSIDPALDVRIEFPKVPWPVPAVEGDPDLLVVAVYNLIANAAKYSDPGARIEIRGTEDEGFVTLEVSDTGWGIAHDEIPFLWDELARGTNARGKEGSGLGLSIVRIIVERHGGTIAMRSAPGQGTRVILRLPVAA
ncbi:sensor histidine kinase [Propionicicella superfundia]|uniref:sensor histidine kinase n=1 Tax=Propionicicella superfundia TaxID=348582 RepID=UPI0003F99379|nr:HAMP domain-containing sensor histidine kinase [Propionicicella superfundia]